MWTKATLTDSSKTEYGFGWSLGDLNGTKIVEHGGGIHGFTTFIKRAPSKGITVIVLTNSDGSNPQAIANTAIGIFEPTLKQVEVKAIANDDAITKLAHESVLAIQSGNLDHKVLTTQFAKLLTPDLEAGAKAQLTGLGKLTTFEMISSRLKDGATVREYRVKFGSTLLKMSIVFDKQGLIAGLAFAP